MDRFLGDRDLLLEGLMSQKSNPKGEIFIFNFVCLNANPLLEASAS